MKKALYIVAIAFLIFFIKVGFFGEIGESNGIVFKKNKQDSGVQIPILKIDTRKARLLFAGDMMFDRTIRTRAIEKSYQHLFSCIHDYVTDFDIVVANLEGAITNNESLSSGTKPGEMNNTAFTFSPIVADVLFKNNIRMVNASNNHSTDFGREGVSSTRFYLKEAGVDYFGSPGDALATTTTVGGFKVTFVNFNQFLGLNDPQKTVDAVALARPYSDFVFVYTHWGDEYVSENEYQRDLAYKFVDAGADMVIGSHPHVIQSHALYKGKHIFYSLGNFIFDQYFSEEVRTGGGVEVLLSPQGIQVNDVRFKLLRDGTTCLG